MEFHPYIGEGEYDEEHVNQTQLDELVTLIRTLKQEGITFTTLGKIPDHFPGIGTTGTTGADSHCSMCMTDI